MQVSGNEMISGTCIFLYLDYLANSNCIGYNEIGILRRDKAGMIKMDKKLPVGVDDFEKLIRNGYYLDKTSSICQLVEWHGGVNLFTRPRRFGKTLNMSMLKAFFEIGTDKSLFDGLDISNESANKKSSRNF